MKRWGCNKGDIDYKQIADKGIGIRFAYSLARVTAGLLLAALLAILAGFLIGMSQLFHKALDPYVQILKPNSPLAWMPLALYASKDSSLSSIFVVFICLIWPMLINTAFVASVRCEWIKAALTLQVSNPRTALKVILPTAAPTIPTGMRISIGIAWLVIVAAWNNLFITGVISAIFFIGVVGMFLEQILAACARAVAYSE